MLCVRARFGSIEWPQHSRDCGKSWRDREDLHPVANCFLSFVSCSSGSICYRERSSQESFVLKYSYSCSVTIQSVQETSSWVF